MARVTLDSDTLNRANNADLGSEWDQAATAFSNLKILDNCAMPATLGSAGIELFNGTLPPDDQWAQITLTLIGDAVYTSCGVYCRGTTSGGTITSYSGRVDRTNAIIAKSVANVGTVLASTPYVGTTGDVVSFECRGTTLELFVNGISKVVTTDATIASGRTGISAFVNTGGSSNYVQLNNFVMGEFDTGGSDEEITLNTADYTWEAFDLTLSAPGAPVSSSGWPNEPTGGTLISDFAFNARGGGTPFAFVPVFAQGGEIINDATAPHSGPVVYRTTWQHSASSGNGAVPTLAGFGVVNEIYMGMWWKPSSPFTGWANQHNKICVFWTTSGTLWFHGLNGPQGGSFRPDLDISTVGANNSHIPGFHIGSTVVQLGVWHRAEVYLKKSATASSRDGIARLWLDNVLQVNVTNMNYPSGINQVQVAQSWDQPEPNFPSAFDFHHFDHIRVTTGGTGGVGEPPPQGGGLLPAPGLVRPVLTTEAYGDVIIQWLTVGGATHYHLTVHKIGTPYESAFFLHEGDIAAPTLTAIVTTEASSEYDYWIKTKNTDGNYGPTNGSRFSTTAVVIIEPPIDPPIEPPIEPPVEPPIDPGPIAPPDTLPPGVSGSVTTTTLVKDRLNPVKKEYRFHG